MDNTSGQDGRILPHLSGHSALPPPSSVAAGRMMLPPPSVPKRKTKNVVTAEDYEQLRKHYTFVLPEKSQSDSTWQERMVRQYHSHLYKEFALADFSTPGKIGFCFRTKEEVVSGLGFRTCGNLRCPSFQQPELYMNRKMAAQNNQLTRQGFPGPPYGEGLTDYEVPFQYMEHGETKMELVKVRLCKVCIPKLMDRSPGGGNKKRAASKRQETNSKPGSNDANSSSSSSDSSSSTSSSEKADAKQNIDSSDSSSTEGSSNSSGDDDDDKDSDRRGKKLRQEGKSKPQLYDEFQSDKGRDSDPAVPGQSRPEEGQERELLVESDADQKTDISSHPSSANESSESSENDAKERGTKRKNASRQKRKERHKRERKRHKHKKRQKDK